MYKLAVERGPAIALWLLALAAQMSGYTNVAIALALVGLAVFFLVAPAYDHAEITSIAAATVVYELLSLMSKTPLTVPDKIISETGM